MITPDYKTEAKLLILKAIDNINGDIGSHFDIESLKKEYPNVEFDEFCTNVTKELENYGVLIGFLR